MDDVVLRTELDDTTSVYISPISRETYAEHVQNDNLGGSRGYFVLRSRRTGDRRLEVLAKVPTLEAATDLLEIIAGNRPSFAQ